MLYRTRVILYGAFWKVQTLRHSHWITHSDNYINRQQARDHRAFWANF